MLTRSRRLACRYDGFAVAVDAPAAIASLVAAGTFLSGMMRIMRCSDTKVVKRRSDGRCHLHLHTYTCSPHVRAQIYSLRLQQGIVCRERSTCWLRQCGLSAAAVSVHFSRSRQFTHTLGVEVPTPVWCSRGVWIYQKTEVTEAVHSCARYPRGWLAGCWRKRVPGPAGPIKNKCDSPVVTLSALFARIQVFPTSHRPHSLKRG